MNKARGAVCGASKLFFSSLGAVALSFVVWCGATVAQVRPEAEYGKYVAKGNTIQPLSNTPFGESINLYDGDLSFQQVDVEVPGIGPTIKLVRSFHVRESGKTYENIGMGFYDWNIEIPRIKTITAVHYGGYPNEPHDWYLGAVSGYNRCSQFGPPPTLSYANDTASQSWEPDEWWDGYYLVDEGSPQVLFLQNAGATYPFTTKGNWRIGCLPNTANGQSGEAFLGVAPDGTRYWFNHLVYTYADPIIKDPRQLDRRYAAMLVTRIEDRFGNWLVYHYTADKLTSISASDGRHVSIAYSNAYSISSVTVDTVDTPSRTWLYQGVNKLNAVVNPDGSRWTFALGQLSGAPQIMPSAVDCHTDASIGEPSPINGSITTPSGLTGTFGILQKKHGRSYTDKLCWGNDEFNTYAWYPKLWYSYTLISRTLTGAGLQPQSWSYTYSAANDSWAQNCPNPTSCPSTIWTDVVDPQGVRERHLFSNKFDHTEALLLKTEVYPQGSASPIRVVNDTYAVAAPNAAWPFPWPEYIGEPYTTRDNNYTKRWTPLSKREIQQDGVNFVWQANTFDARARSLSATRSSSLGYSRTDVTAYYDDTTKWVLGQVASSTNTDSGLVESQTDYWPATALPQRVWSFGKTRQYFEYNANGTLAKILDGNNHATLFANWKRGIPQSITFADTKSKSAVVNDHGLIDSVTDETGAKTCYGYDLMGRMTSITYPSESLTGICNQDKWLATTLSFAPSANAVYGLPAGHWQQLVTTGNARTVTVFDALWRPVVKETADLSNLAGTISQTVTRYDVDSRVIYTSYPQRTLNPAIYNTWGNPAVAPNALGSRTAYDALGRPIEGKQDSEYGPLTSTTEYLTAFQTRTTSPGGSQTTTSYMAFDQPSTDWPKAIAHPEGTYTDITRDLFGKPRWLTRRNASSSVSATRTYVYDAYQQLCKAIDPETGSTAMSYDNAGNLAWSAAGLALPSSNCDTASVPTTAMVMRTYDARDRIQALTFPDGQGNQGWTYTADGLPEQVTTQNSGVPAVNTYTYNHRRLMTGEGIAQSPGYSWGIGYAYNLYGQRTVVQYPNGQALNLAYNALGQTVQASSAGQDYATAVSYYPNGAIEQFTYGNGLLHRMLQNERQLPDVSCDFLGTCNAAAVLNDGYDYDLHGNVRSISDGTTGNRGNRNMTYDGLDRLKYVASPMYGTTGANYSYDVLDNLTRVNIGGTAARDHYYCYDANWRLTNVKTGSCGGTTVIGLGYDVRGNLANKNGQAYAFDTGNRLRQATGLETYRYDAHGRRIQASTTQPILSQYTSDGALLYQQDDRRGLNLNYVYLGGSLIAIREQPTLGGAVTVKYQHTDALGTPVAVTDASRVVIEKSEYEPFGGLLNRPLKDGPGYTGHVSDAATGLSYMQQRYYDPLLAGGRFLSVDPVTAGSMGGNFNRYWYANNNPYKFIDPDGRQSALFGVTAQNSEQLKLQAKVAPILAAGQKAGANELAQRSSINAKGTMSAGTGIKAQKNIAGNNNDSVGWVPVGQGAYAGVTGDFRAFSVDLLPGTASSPISLEASADVGAIGSVGGSVSLDAGGKLDITISLGLGIGEHTSFSPTLNIETNKKDGLVKPVKIDKEKER